MGAQSIGKDIGRAESRIQEDESNFRIKARNRLFPWVFQAEVYAVLRPTTLVIDPGIGTQTQQ